MDGKPSRSAPAPARSCSSAPRCRRKTWRKPLIEFSPEQMRSIGYRVIDLVVDHFANLKNRPVGARAAPEYIRPLLSGLPSEDPVDPLELIARLERDVFPNILHVD